MRPDPQPNQNTSEPLGKKQGSSSNPSPLYIINSIAPIRICDLGGWTDTWFAEHGRILNIGVSPFVEVQIEVYPASARQDRLVIHAENYGDRYSLNTQRRTTGAMWGKHPLLEAAIEVMDIPEDLALEITIYSDAPGGASTGTSAAVTVALIGGLDCLTPGRMSLHEVAMMAHRVETEMLGQQSGIQDQLCAAYGGIHYIEMYQYPDAIATPVSIAESTRWELERQLALIYLGNSHNSSQVHEMVIQDLKNAGPDNPQIEALRRPAQHARDALISNDLSAFGLALQENTEAQRQLHPKLVSDDAELVIEIAKKNGALGWKVNGAGGEGGSLTLLCGSRSDARRSLIREIETQNSSFRNIPIVLRSTGLRVWRSDHRQRISI